MDIYIKPPKKVSISAKKTIHISDITEIYTDASLMKKAGAIPILFPKQDTKKNYLLSALDIIKLIDRKLPGNTIVNVGETDILLDYQPEAKKESKLWLVLLTSIISLILLAGSATAIMSFHTDSQIPVVFKNYYYIIFGEKLENPALIDIPYSIGLAVGIIIFFNHFSMKKITSDPTPIEIEMALYEGNVTDTIIDRLSQESNGRGRDEGGGK